jgi:prepilin-type N-terminal cleavage/methylation domain
MIIGDNMKNKGFTLVELLAVIVLLGLIALVAVPAITGIIKKGKDSLSASQIESIEMSAKNWASDKENIVKLPTDGKCVYIFLSTLQSSGYADLDVKDPKTGKSMSNTLPIVIKRESKQLIFEVNPINITSCVFVG